MTPIITIKGLSKVYKSGNIALNSVSLEIKKGEILSLLGPNGAGKTTLISMICGLARLTNGSIKVGGFDIIKDYRNARKLIGLVPQEVALEPFETVINTVKFSRGLFGYSSNASYIQSMLKMLSLWEQRHTPIKELSGGMKRRVLIAKALSHEPKVLFLDEPTAGVDVELRKDMWTILNDLKTSGVTILLTTHYIEEAEAIADRVAVIVNGSILLVEEKNKLMERMGTKILRIELQSSITKIPESLICYDLTLADNGEAVTYIYDTKAERTGITSLLTDLANAGLILRDLKTSQSSLEDIFVNLVKE